MHRTTRAIKASAGKLKGYYIYNPNAAAAYVNVYNTAQGSVTVGTTNENNRCLGALQSALGAV